MANLLDALNQNQLQATQSPPATNNTQAIASLLRAKSGKAGAGPSAAISNQQEQAANAQTGIDLSQVAQSANIQNQGQQIQSQGIQQDQSAQMESLNQARQGEIQKAQIQTAQTLQNLQQSKGKIDAQKYQETLEAVGQNMRLANQQYIDQLTVAGDMARLDDGLKFKEQIQQTVFEDQQALLQKQLGDKSVLDVNANQFEISLANMGVYDSYQMFQSAMANEQQRALASGIGTIATTSLGAWANSASKAPAPAASSGPAPTPSAASNQSTAGDNPIFSNEPGYSGGK